MLKKGELNDLIVFVRTDRTIQKGQVIIVSEFDFVVSWIENNIQKTKKIRFVDPFRIIEIEEKEKEVYSSSYFYFNSYFKVFFLFGLIIIYTLFLNAVQMQRCSIQTIVKSKSFFGTTTEPMLNCGTFIEVFIFNIHFFISFCLYSFFFIYWHTGCS